jgi:hypothetical protein
MTVDDVTPPIAGLHLRYLLTLHLFDAGESTIGDLVAAVGRQGFRLDGRPSKTVSDALRWELRRGRVVRRGRGRYAPGVMPRQTQSWMRQRLRSLRLEVARPPEPVALPPVWSRVQPPSDNVEARPPGSTQGRPSPAGR